MVVTDLFVGELATELLKKLFKISRKAYLCKQTADHFLDSINELLPIIQEIQFSGVKLPETRERQLDNLSQLLGVGHEVAGRVLKSSRWNVYKNLQLARKMEKVDKTVTKFLQGPIQLHMLADVHHLRFESAERFNWLHNSNQRLEQLLGSMKDGTSAGEVGGSSRLKPLALLL